MIKGKRPDGKRKSVTARTNRKPTVQESTTDPRTRPTTYEIMQIDSDDELGMVRMTPREIFELNCPGETPEQYEGMPEKEIRARMRARASQLTVFEDKWHPEDVGKVADACTDYILEFREMKRLDAALLNKVKVPATPVQRHKG